MSILLTGFEPFGGSARNPSAEVLTALGQHGPALTTLLLPVDTARAPELLRAALLELRPRWCVMLGEARGRAAINVERVAINLLDFAIPDNAGVQLSDRPIVEGGPDAYLATLPVRQLQAAILEAGVPAELSLSAGSYLCNQVSYVALHTAATEGLSTRCGFLHLPSLPEQIAEEGLRAPSMARATICDGVAAALRALDE